MVYKKFPISEYYFKIREGNPTEVLETASQNKNPALNGGFFHTFNDEHGNKYGDPINDMVINHKIVSQRGLSDYGIFIRDDLSIGFGKISEDYNYFIGGSPVLYENGVFSNDNEGISDSLYFGKYYRSFFGVTTTDIIIGCTDEIVSIPTLKEMLIDFDFISCIALDGGGSSHIFTGEFAVFPSGENRAVANHIIIERKNTTMEIPGIDVSRYQNIIDWQQVKESGQKFAIIQVGYCGYDGLIVEGKGLDYNFKTNIEGAIAAGVDVGVYVYSYAKTIESAKIAADEVIRLCKPYKLTYPICFDFEDNIYKSMDKQLNTNICKAFLQQVESYNFYGMLYSYTNFLENYLDYSQLKAFDLWVADYRGYMGFDANPGIWQFSSTGKVLGISTDCDLNYAYKDYPTIIKNAGLNGLEFTQPLSTESVSLKIGFASAGDVKTIVEVAGENDIYLSQPETGYLITPLLTPAEQIILIELCNSLIIPIVIYEEEKPETPTQYSKVSLYFTDKQIKEKEIVLQLLTLLNIKYMED